MTVTEWLRSRCLAKVITSPIGDKPDTLDVIEHKQWSEEFEIYRRNRMLVGYFRYGGISTKNNKDNVGSAIARLKLYQDTGNLEHLVDVANLAMVEFMESTHPNKHFSSEDDGIHVESKK